MAEQGTAIAGLRVVLDADHQALVKGLEEARQQVRGFSTESSGLLGLFDQRMGGLGDTIEGVRGKFQLMSTSAQLVMEVLGAFNAQTKEAFSAAGMGEQYAEFEGYALELAGALTNLIPAATGAAVSSFQAMVATLNASADAEDEYVTASKVRWTSLLTNAAETTRENADSMVHQIKRWSNPETWDVKTAEQEILHLQSVLNIMIASIEDKASGTTFDLSKFFGLTDGTVEGAIKDVTRAAERLVAIRDKMDNTPDDATAKMLERTKKEVDAINLRIEARSMEKAAGEAYIRTQEQVNALIEKGSALSEAMRAALAQSNADFADANERMAQIDRDKSAVKSIDAMEREVESSQRKVAALDMERAAGDLWLAAEDKIAKLRADGATVTDDMANRIRRLAAAQQGLNDVVANRRQDVAQDNEISESAIRGRERVILIMERDVAISKARTEALGLSSAAQASAAFEQRVLNDLRQAGVDIDDEMLIRIQQTKQALTEQAQAQEDYRYNLATMQAVTSTATRSMESAFRQWTNGATIDVKEMVRSMLSELAMLSLRRGILEPLSAGISGQGGLLSGLIGGFRADGGPVDGGVPYVVGERGPELFVPSSSGTVLPNGVTLSSGGIPIGGGGGGGVSAPITIMINAQGAYPESIADIRREVTSLNQTLPGRVVAHVAEARDRGIL